MNPVGGETHNTQGMYLNRWTKHKIGVRKRGNQLGKVGEEREQRCVVNKQKIRQNVTRARSRTEELSVLATWNVRSLSLTGRRGAAIPRSFCRNVK